jgi:hypothetical protein
MKIDRIFLGILGSTILICPSLVQAQPQQESVAEAARKVRAEKKPSIRPAVVLTNDNLDTIKGTVSVLGPAPAPAPAAAPTVAAPPEKSKTDATAGPAKPLVKDEGYWRDQFKTARKTLADDVHELDILQREYNLKQQQYYSDPNVALREQYTSKDLTDTKKNIDDKTAAVAKDKQSISDLEDSLRQSGGDVGWSREP